ncbi:PP2C family protein-serine/threonine phosphatase [Streptacidiphilus griseoplanus]|uniref:PP2C family protein-serine/threonine phosphatase n=1 Tax=Peterkaempfera griseoplana TaxID=66896 RepID=UPI001FE19BA8|nr:PP2C family protein-serine/threonine phosphatase [Peterkaempfera griseoplana]
MRRFFPRTPVTWCATHEGARSLPGAGVPKRLKARGRGTGPLGLRGHAVPPLLLIAAITSGASFAPLAVHLSPLLVAAPTCTGTFARARFTGVVALLTAAAVLLVDRHDGLLHSPLLPIHIGSVLIVSAFVIASRTVHDRDLRELAQVRAVSEAAQRVLLRPIPAQLGPLRVASMYRAAAAHALVGGDLYAAARTGHTTRILIGDVRGKGLPAIDDASAVLGAFRESAQQYRTLPELAASLERSVRRHLSELSRIAPDSSERFITALLIEFPDDEGIARVVSCGHPPPLLRQGSRLTLLSVTRPAPPLGLAADTPNAFSLDTVAFGPGDTLLLYTDGLAEARDSAGTFFPVLDRAETWTWGCPRRLVQHISVDVDRHAGKNLQDDLALVAVHHPRRPVRSEQAPS